MKLMSNRRPNQRPCRIQNATDKFPKPAQHTQEPPALSEPNPNENRFHGENGRRLNVLFNECQPIKPKSVRLKTRITLMSRSKRRYEKLPSSVAFLARERRHAPKAKA